MPAPALTWPRSAAAARAAADRLSVRPQDPYDLPETVRDREGPIAFVRLLEAADSVAQARVHPVPPRSPGANGWENRTADRFLEAAVAWAKASPPIHLGPALQNPWRFCAETLQAGTV